MESPVDRIKISASQYVDNCKRRNASLDQQKLRSEIAKACVEGFIICRNCGVESLEFEAGKFIRTASLKTEAHHFRTCACNFKSSLSEGESVYELVVERCVHAYHETCDYTENDEEDFDEDEDEEEEEG